MLWIGELLLAGRRTLIEVGRAVSDNAKKSDKEMAEDFTHLSGCHHVCFNPYLRSSTPLLLIAMPHLCQVVQYFAHSR